MSKDGGSGQGTIRFKEELAHGGNAGLGTTAVVWMEDVKKKYGDSLSYADLYTLGGGKICDALQHLSLRQIVTHCTFILPPKTKVVAIKELGGPTIKWRYVLTVYSWKTLCLPQRTILTI